ncbi:MAG: NAD(P)-binding protein, partial [Actinomycetota bacterium]|nr:NAD(P)-binding protein [Actinomycetota bacterium]
MARLSRPGGAGRAQPRAVSLRVAVIGAGVAGLAAAYELGKSGARCDVYE